MGNRGKLIIKTLAKNDTICQNIVKPLTTQAGIKEEKKMNENKIIAEFMAVKKEVDTQREYFLLPNMKTETRTGWYQVESMQYHTSWDWLMPVVEKIESLNYISQIYMMNGKHLCYFSTEEMDGEGRIICETIKPTKIESVYSAVREFINWYNSTHP